MRKSSKMIIKGTQNLQKNPKSTKNEKNLQILNNYKSTKI